MSEYKGKVVLNYQYYKGIDGYSDGDIEEDLLALVKQESDMEKIIEKDHRWPILYHLSPVRQNILEWYQFQPDASVLEIGAGCGAITALLARKTKEVTCVELSKRRSIINAERNKNCGNVEILVGNFNDIQWEKKYDYITLIGVLEYASYYTEAVNPFEAFLKKIKTLLNPGGKVLIAIENKFGLKYWAGAREDHTGYLFDGIEGYHRTDSKVYTFSQDELRNTIKKAGFKKTYFYYPFPDYKFPSKIFSEDYLPKAEELVYSPLSYDNDRIILFNETAAYHELVKCGKFEFFSNSFLVEAD